MTEKEKKFMEIDLAAEIASQSLSWDEVEDLGYIMLEEGHRQKYKPSSIASFGLGGLHEPDLFVLLDRKEQGEDITRELVLGLSGLGSQNMIMGVRSDPNNLYSEQFMIYPDQRWETENGYMLKYGKAEKEVTYKEIEEAYMKRITDEWERLGSYEEEEKVEYEYIRSKSVQDSDGFMTYYAMYRQKGTDKYVFVYGDNSVYTADDGNFDYECEGETHANEWFNSYGEEEEETKGLYPEEVLVPMPGADKLSELKAEYDPAVKKAIEDYEKGREFPDNGNFNGLGNYHIIAELNDVVLGVRNTDFTYATWQGDSEYGVSGGNYMMTREKAFEDFALRAQLIDSDRYIDPEKERKDYEELLNEKLDFNGSSLSEKQFNELIDRILEDAHSENLKQYIVETNTEEYREENLFNDDLPDLSRQSTSNKL